jgi:hypothetical protein
LVELRTARRNGSGGADSEGQKQHSGPNERHAEHKRRIALLRCPLPLCVLVAVRDARRAEVEWSPRNHRRGRGKGKGKGSCCCFQTSSNRRLLQVQTAISKQALIVAAVCIDRMRSVAECTVVPLAGSSVAGLCHKPLPTACALDDGAEAETRAEMSA